ncbi:MAG: hypothetical protein PVH12_03525 [Candidatus Bathyarchaeota archaeon]|jgi:hypothetical protein
MVKRYVADLIGVLAILVVFFLPFGFMIDLAPQGPNSIVSMFWEIQFRPAGYSVRFFSAFRYYFGYCFFRFFVLFDVFLLLNGRYNKKRLHALGIISEIIPLTLAIVSTFIRNAQGDNLHPIIFPIPFLLIFVKILIHSEERLEIL